MMTGGRKRKEKADLALAFEGLHPEKESVMLELT